MDIFGVGILEIAFILIIGLIVLGPDGMVKFARSAGTTIRKIIKSPFWSSLMKTEKEIRKIPTQLIREAGIEEDLAEIRRTQAQLRNPGIHPEGLYPSAYPPDWKKQEEDHSAENINQQSLPPETDPSNSDK